MQKNTPPTHWEIMEMNRLYKEEGKSGTEIGKILGFHRNTVYRYLNVFKQYVPNPEYILDGVNLKTKTWSKEDSQYIVDYYPVVTVTELAYALDKTPNQVTSRIMHLRRRGLLQERKRRGRPRREI